jgi:hypothetical protein
MMVKEVLAKSKTISQNKQNKYGWWSGSSGSSDRAPA